MENRIKDQQLCLFADRTSSTRWWTNQWRLLLSGFAYTLFERLRAHLKKTPFERMSASNLRLKLIKVGAVIIRNTRDRKSTRLNSSHVRISYAVFCLKKKTYTEHSELIAFEPACGAN